MPGHLLHGEEQPELPCFIYFGFPASLGADQEGSNALSKPQHPHRIHQEHHLGLAALMGTVFWHHIPLLHLLAPFWMPRELA